MKQRKYRVFAVCLIVILVFSAHPNFVQADEVGETQAKAYALIEANTGQMIAQRNAEEKLPVAGLTKLMSFLLCYEAIEQGAVRADDLVSVSQEAAKKGGTSVFLDAGSQYSFETLLGAAIICSANDATVALAEHIAGNEAAFVQRMNERAGQLGLSCVFSDATGISEQTMMSANDLAIIASALAKYPAYFKYSSVWLSTFTHASGRETQMSSANKLIKSEGFDGMLTGSSAAAGYCLAGSLKSGSARYICVVLGDAKTDDRFTFAKGALNYAAATYSVKQIAQKGAKVKEASLTGSGNQTVNIYAAEDLSLLLKKGEEQGIQKQVEIAELIPPLAAGEQVGSLTVTLPGGETRSVPLVLQEAVEETGFYSSLRRILACWLA